MGRLHHVIARAAVFGLIVTCTATPSAARRMEKVIQECETAGDLATYISCIKSTYAKKGNWKNEGTVHAFYALLDEIQEAADRAKATSAPMSRVAERANVYRAWQATIGATNEHQPGKICSMNETTLVCS